MGFEWVQKALGPVVRNPRTIDPSVRSVDMSAWESERRARIALSIPLAASLPDEFRELHYFIQLSVRRCGIFLRARATI